mgnify:CR=1 FL=1
MIKLFDENKTEEQWTMNDVKEYVKTYFTYEEEIKALQESKREWSKDFLEQKNIPKKELAQAIQIMKKELDTETLFEMTGVISEMKE